jgi:hypothetical protein
VLQCKTGQYNTVQYNTINTKQYNTVHASHKITYSTQGNRLYAKLQNEKSCSSRIVRVIKSRRMRWAGHVVRMEERRGVYRVLVGRPGGQRPLGSPRRRWEDNIKMDLQELGCAGMDWVGLAQDRDKLRDL